MTCIIYHFSTLNFSLILFIFFYFRLHYCYLNFIANLKKMKIYSNKRDMKQQERNVLGWREKCFGLKKGNTLREKEKRGAKEEEKGGRQNIIE